MYTEEEARKKWCPFARTLQWETVGNNVGDSVGAAINRDVGWDVERADEKPVIKGRHQCIASECMAWRWKVDPHDYVNYQSNFTWDDQRKSYIPLAEESIKLPDGDGWSLHKVWQAANCLLTEFRRPKRPEDQRGYCGLAGKPHGDS